MPHCEICLLIVSLVIILTTLITSNVYKGLVCNQSKDRPVFQGYISRASQSATFKLDFDDHSGDYRTLCNNRSSGCNSSSTVKSTTAPITDTDMKNTTTGLTPPTRKITTTEAVEITTKPTTLKENDESSTTYTSSTSDMNMSVNGATLSSIRKDTKGLVAVYVIIPLIIVIVIAVVGIIIWRRRSLQEKGLNSTHVTTTPPRQGPMNGGDGISNAAYQEEFPAQTVIRSTGHEYLVLDPIGTGYAAIGDIDPEDGEYDTTRKVKQSMRNNEENNIYNRLNDGVDQIYDHAGVGHNHGDSGCNYSHSSIYNTPDNTNENRNVLNRRSRDDTDNDTYNHAISNNNSQGDNETCEKDNAYNHLGSETRHLEYTDSDMTYDHTIKTTHGGKIGDSENYQAVRTIDTVVAKEIGNAKPIYEYAQVNTDYKKKDSKSGMLTIEKQESENYEFAKEPPSSADYEFAKPPLN